MLEESGMSVGSASIVSSRVTCSSTPPSLTPGASSAPTQLEHDGRLDRQVEAHAQQVDVDGVAASPGGARAP